MADIKLLGNDDQSWDTVQAANYFQIEKFQAVKSGTVTMIKIYGYAKTNIKLAIYSDNAGAADALLASATGYVNASDSWFAISFPKTNVSAGTYYWLAHCVEVNYTPYAISSGGTAKYKSVLYSSFTFPNPAGSSGWTNDTWRFALAGWGAESAGGSNIELVGAGLCGGRFGRLVT